MQKLLHPLGGKIIHSILLNSGATRERNGHSVCDVYSHILQLSQCKVLNENIYVPAHSMALGQSHIN